MIVKLIRGHICCQETGMEHVTIDQLPGKRKGTCDNISAARKQERTRDNRSAAKNRKGTHDNRSAEYCTLEEVC